MKHIPYAALLVCILLCSCAVNKTQTPVRTITVDGTGTVSVVPDTATAEFAVITQNWVAQNASSDNATIMTNVMEALQNAGIKKADITTSGYEVNQQNSWADGKLYPGKYTVSNRISVVSRTPDQLGPVIDAAISAGANGLTALSFSVSDDADAVRKARVLAMQQALDTASQLAGTGGCKIGEVITIAENDSGQPYAPDRMLKSASYADRAATPVSAGTVTVSSHVTVTYALQ